MRTLLAVFVFVTILPAVSPRVAAQQLPDTVAENLEIINQNDEVVQDGVMTLMCRCRPVPMSS